jgi:DNA-binding MarR family transcriptional regulator
MKAQETVDFNIKSAWHAIFRMYNTEAAKHEITTSIGYVLINIDEANGTPATKIGPMMGMEIHSLSRMLKSMVEKGLIIKSQDKNDKRVTRIFLTELGKQKRDISKKTIRTFNHAVMARVSKKKLDAFFDVVEDINSLVEENNLFTD